MSSLRRAGRPQQRSEDRATLLVVVVFVLIASGVPAALSVCSRQPDLYYASPKASCPAATAVSWPELQQAWISALPPAWLAGEIEIAGYAFAPEPGAAAAFRLVPSAGDWLHPPHFHPDETIEVLDPAGVVATPLPDRVPVLVRGRISKGVLDSGRASGFAMTATGWHRWQAAGSPVSHGRMPSSPPRR
jgi:hypothetical protein